MKRKFIGVLGIVAVLAVIVTAGICARSNTVASAKEIPVEVSSSWYDDTEYNDYNGTLLAINNMLSNMTTAEKQDIINNPIVVAVIDTGINYNHELFEGLLYENPLEKNGTSGVDDDKNGYTDDVCGWDAVSGDNDPKDECDSSTLDGHGSHVAGIIATEILKYGLQDYIRILPIRAGNSSGSFSTTNVVNALTYAINIKTQNNLTMVINMSFKNKLTAWTKTGKVNKKIQEGVKAGIIMVAAAGNDGDGSDNGDYYTGAPAAFDNVIGVMAYQGSETNIRCYNYGSAYDLAAPGYQINSASRTNNTGYTIKNGTSMASPMVSFMAAVLSINFERDSSMVYESIIKTSRDLTGKVNIVENPGKTTEKIVYTAKKANLSAFLQYNPIKQIEIKKISGDDAQHINSTSKISFETYLYKYGSDVAIDITDPAYQNITMYIAKCDENGNPTDEIVYEVNARTIEYLPEIPGTFAVYALNLGYSTSLYTMSKFVVTYANIDDANLALETPDDKVRVDGEYTYSVQNLYKIDPANTVTWTLYDENDVIVAVSKDDTFTFTPTDTGAYTIICKIGSRVIAEESFKVYISSADVYKIAGGVSSGILLLISFSVLIIAILKIRKKSA